MATDPPDPPGTSMDEAYDRLTELMDRARATPLDSTPPLTVDRAEELIAELRRSRSQEADEARAPDG